MKFFASKKNKRRATLGQRRKRMFRIKIAALVIVVISLIALLSWLVRLPEVTVSDVFISGNKITKTEEIQAVVDSHLAGTYLFLLPKKNVFVYPGGAIEKDLENTFTRIEEVRVRKQNFRELHVTITERAPFALWCGEMFKDTDVELGNCYFIDEESYVFAKAPDFTGNVFFKYFGVLAGETGTTTNPLGHIFMTEIEFDSTQVFLETFDGLGYIPVSFTRTRDGDFEIGMESGAKILFGDDTRFAVVLDNFQSVMESDALRNVDQRNIEYIDLRFGSKVFYKLIGEEESEG